MGYEITRIKKKKVQKSTELVSENSLTGNQNEGFT